MSLFNSISAEMLTIPLLVCTCVYLFFVYTFSYWRRRGIKCMPTSIPFGNFGPAFTMKKHMAELLVDIYHQTTEPFIGMFACFRPALLVRDLDLIQHVLVKDFNHFVDRGVYMNEKVDPLSAHVAALSGDRWRKIRTKLTPAFTTGKLKATFSSISTCSVPLKKLLSATASRNESIEIRDIAARYTTDVIASVAFGVEVNSVDNPNNSFREYGRRFFDLNWRNGLRWLGIFLFPGLMGLLKIRWVDHDIERFMMTLVKETLDNREKNQIVRKDFFQLLLQIRNTGTVQHDDQWKATITAAENDKKLTLSEMAANSFVFFIGGYETTSGTTSFCLFELARNPDVQRKLHEEIDRVLAKHEGQITYEAIAEMTYLDNCFDETLRKYPSLPMLNRECTTEYRIPGTDVVLEKGTFLLIPILALQRDEKYFPEPMKFIPERFSDKSAIQPMTYLPFGEGPRICIGLRYAKLQSKVALVLMMQHYRYELTDPQYYHKELPISPGSAALTPTCGIHLTIRPRKNEY